MKKFFLSLAAVLTMGSMMAQSNAELGKKWFEAERYDKALDYLVKAVDEGDIDSKARLATMIFTMQVPEYSMDQEGALRMLDECIEAGSVYAIERKGFCNLLMGKDTKEDKLASLALLEEASSKGNGDASAQLMQVYMNGLVGYADGSVYVEKDTEKMVQYGKLACEQGNAEGMAWLGYWMQSGSYGIEKDAATGLDLIEKANDLNPRVVAGSCVEPAKALIKSLRANGKATKAAAVEKLMKQYNPSER